MLTEALLRDPVFQLNLLLWMAKDQPPDAWRVRPVFQTLGFEIIYVEQPFAFPVEMQKKLSSVTDLPISIEPEPDIILGRYVDNKALYFEAKANSFGAESKTCKQARGHLLAAGPVFGEVLRPLQTCLLCYVLPNDKRQLMDDCLRELTQQLTDKNFAPGQHSVHGLSVNGKTLIYSWDDACKSQLNEATSEFSIIEDLAEDTDPSPLVLVFTDEDCPNDAIRGFYRRVVIDQCHAALLCDLHYCEVGCSYVISSDELLHVTTQGVFKYIGRQRQKNLQYLIRENFFKPIYEAWKGKTPGAVTLSGTNITIQWNSEDEKKSFLEWLEDRRGKFPDEKPPAEEPTLFDSLATQDTQSLSTEEDNLNVQENQQ